MSQCGQSPLYVPTTVNAVLRNIDAVDCAATNLSCTNLTVNGEPVSNVLTNIGSSTVGNTVFNGTVTATNFTASGTVTAGTVSANYIGAPGAAITGGNVATTGSIASGTDVSGATLTGTIATPTQNNITKIGTQTSFASSGSITQTGGSTTLLGTTVSSLSSTGNISQSTGTTATLRALTADSLTTAGNITQTGASATATLKAVTATSLSVSGSLSFANLTNTGTLDQQGSATFAGGISQTGGTTSLLDTTVSGTLSGNPNVNKSGSITIGAATFTTPTALFTGYGSYTIRWWNLGISGNFTPYLRFKSGTTTLTSGYRSTSNGDNVQTSNDKVVLSGSTAGLATGELVNGELTVYRSSGASNTWFYRGFSQSSTANGWTIFGLVNTANIDAIVFGTTGATLNNPTATYTVVFNP